ncbi:type I DNA topoisomerase [Carboxydochorda subterranea]|uniref:DNA topoisomerase 1 n=1 Tax=Carboxydichorda subterranea TaxID=3109565 RepID=A0ABZ1C0R2_9FIRM|nr:type I DNA topoisomerase [Limnochorda sp. L945t]WRP18440.1 type I DNA topoisomerase [Limnochorda sp. L945t]
MKLVIVESPAKARTLSKFLGSSYKVRASMGHVRDLPITEFGIDVKNGFRPRYTIIRGKTRTVKELESEAKQAAQVLLATDPDREGEAISWHLSQLLGLPADQPCRIEFHEVTRRAVQQALDHVRPIDQRLVDAQQARRILDRVVGYRLSPLLWKKVRRGLSAGRVQSVALRLICDREDEIEAFVSKEYWTIDAVLLAGDGVGAQASFVARLVAYEGKEVEIPDEPTATRLAGELEQAALHVAAIRSSRRQRRAPPPFTTSTLQQEAARRLGFTARRTMQLAQQLYEGLDVGDEGPVGLITYMRTDSVHVADEARQAARQYIGEHFGPEFVPERPNVYKSGKGAQEAHEAIRPTSVERHPESVKAYLNRDQWRLYDLIWRRFMASQMVPALVESTVVEVEGGPFRLKATGSTVIKPGYLELWAPHAGAPGSGTQDADGRAKGAAESEGAEDEEGRQALPSLMEGQPLGLREVQPRQHFTQPPPRYNDASLVKTMEELGIGRPSTYAPTIETLLERRYCQRDGPRLVPTPLGRAVVRLLKEQFPDIVDVEFTARMESQLDAIEAGKLEWQRVIAEFYPGFESRIEQAMQTVGRVAVQDEVTDEKCEVCGRPMVIKWGRFGQFLACSGYPECKHTRPLVRHTGARCPRCGGELLERRSRRGRVFYGCSRYPTCTYTLWQRPVGRQCPRCGRPLVVQGGRGKSAGQVVCAGWYEKTEQGERACDYRESAQAREAPQADGRPQAAVPAAERREEAGAAAP